MAFALSAACALAMPASIAFAQSTPVMPVDPAPENLALAREIIANGFPQEIRHEMFASVMTNIIAQVRKATDQDGQDPGVIAIMDRHMKAMHEEMLVAVDKHTPAIFDSFARAYAREFSLADLNVIRDFSRTSAGRNYISRSSRLLGDVDVAAANQAFMHDALAGVAPASEKLKAELVAYFEAHPSALPE